MFDLLGLLSGLLFGAGVLFGVSWYVQLHIRLDGALQRTAHSLGLGYYPGTLFKPARVAGDARGVRVTVECRHTPGNLTNMLTRFRNEPDLSNTLAYTRITVWADLPDGVRFAVETGSQATRRALSDTAVVTGDPAFDNKVVAIGAPGDVLPLLSVHARNTVQHVICELGATIQQGVIEVKRPGYIRDPHVLTTLTRGAIRMGAALVGDGRSYGARLAAIAEDDEVEGVRSRALALLLARADDAQYARDAVFTTLRQARPELVLGGDGTETTLMELLKDRSEPVRLAAAVGLGSYGTSAALDALTTIAGDYRASPDLKALAAGAAAAIRAESAASSPAQSSDS